MEARDPSVPHSEHTSAGHFSLYFPLAAGKIRLLQLESAATDDVVRFRLQTFRLEDKPAYKALSYVWVSQSVMMCFWTTINGYQGPKELKKIVVNDYEVTVRVNLYKFLTVFCKMHQCASIWLWVDQLCIDQRNAEERGYQVSVMDRIYAGAEETFIWLNPDPVECLAIEAVKSLDVDASPSEYIADDAVLAAIERLVENLYWGRHWVAQEIILSPVKTVISESGNVSWSHLVPILRTFEEEKGRYRNSFLALADLQLFFEMRAESRGAGYAYIVWRTAMALGEVTKCEDLRDKIYGIQSLLDVRYRVKVDYSTSIRLAFVDAVTHYDYILRPDQDHAWIFADGCTFLADGLRLHFLGHMQSSGKFRNELHSYKLSKASWESNNTDAERRSRLLAIIDENVEQ